MADRVLDAVEDEVVEEEGVQDDEIEGEGAAAADDSTTKVRDQAGELVLSLTTHVVYQHARVVRCELCQKLLFCGFCNVQLSFPPGATIIQCPKCSGQQDPYANHQTYCPNAACLVRLSSPRARVPNKPTHPISSSHRRDMYRTCWRIPLMWNGSNVRDAHESCSLARSPAPAFGRSRPAPPPNRRPLAA